MTSKTHLNKITQIFNNEENAIANMNANVDILNDVIDDYVSRAGKVPTQMQSPLDMGSQKIINVGVPTDDNDVVRYKDVKDALDELHSVEADIQDINNAVTRANNAASSANQSATEAYNSKETAVAAKVDAVQAKDDAVAAEQAIRTLLTEDYPEITTVANNISDVQTVAANVTDVNTVAGVSSDVTTVAGVASDVSTVAGDTSNIATVAGISSDVSAVAGVASDISTVEGIASDVSTVAGIASDVSVVAGNASNVSTVAGMSSDISDVVTNMTAIQGASQNASDAAASAELAHKWATSSTVVESGQYGASYYALRAANYENGAESARDTARDWATKTDGLVESTDYSSKYYAQQAAAIVATLGSVLVYKGSVATYADLPATGNHIGDVWNVLADGKNYAWDGTAWDDFGGAVTVSIATASDVSLTNLQNGEVLIYNSTTQKWENGTVSGGASSLTDIAVAGDNITFEPYGTDNITIVGSVTLNNHVLSNFSSSNYATAQFTPETGPFAWKAVVKVKAGSTTTGVQRAMCLENLFMMHFNGGKLHFEPSGLSDYTSTVSVSSGTTYYMCIEFDGTDTYTYSYSNDGNTWTTLNTVSGSFSPNYTNQSTIYLGIQWTGQYYTYGSIDLQGCYLEIDGVKVWEGFTQTGKTAINAVIPSGTLANTATGTNSLTILGSASSQSNSINIGATSSVSNGQTTAIGYNSKAYGSSSVAIGYKAYAYGGYSIYIGQPYSTGYSAEGSYSICVGYNTRTRGGNDIALGYYSNTYGGNCIAIGSNATASSNGGNCIAIGNSAQSTGTYAIQLGQGTNSNANTFSVGLSSSNNYQLLNSSGEIPEARMAQVIISGASDPTTATVGTVGLLYRNTTDGGIFKCTDTTGSVFTWEELGAGGSSGVAKETYTNPALTASDNYCTWTITHGLNTKDVVVSVYRTDDDVEPMVNIIHRTTSTVLVVFNSSADIAAGAYKAVIIG